MDSHGNVSPYVTFLPEVTTGADGAPRTFLELAGANPGRGAFALRFGLAQRAHVSLAILAYMSSSQERRDYHQRCNAAQDGLVQNHATLRVKVAK